VNQNALSKWGRIHSGRLAQTRRLCLRFPVARHQAITHHRYGLELHRLAEQLQINHPFRIARQNKLATVATLRHLVRDIRDNYPR
jgi:hypothetical protein